MFSEFYKMFSNLICVLIFFILFLNVFIIRLIYFKGLNKYVSRSDYDKVIIIGYVDICFIFLINMLGGRV